jgi:proton glutamate symport protein
MAYNVSHMAAGQVIDGHAVKGWTAVGYLLGRYARLVGSFYFALAVLFVTVFVPILWVCGVRVFAFLGPSASPR